MKLYGLIGFPLGHSFSRRYFTEKFDREGIADCEYRNFPIESIEEVSRLLSRPELQGFNVTIPYKQQIIPYLSALSDEARAIGAVNCVRLGPDGPVGYNTDAFGFRRSLLSQLGGARPERALVLGTGGASKAVGYVLGELGIPFDSVSRDSNKCRFTYGTLTADGVGPPADRQRDAAGNLPSHGRIPAHSLRGNRPRTLSVRSGLQSAAHGISAEGSRTGRRNAQRLRHARRASRTGMGNLERETVTAPDREAAMRFS